MNTTIRALALVFSIIISLFTANAQPEKKYPVNYISAIKSFDLSKILHGDSQRMESTGKMVPFPDPLGYIGDNYQRFYIHFINVSKSAENPYKYNVTGKTRVRNSICSFTGTITITEAKLYKQGYNPNFKQGYINCNIAFYEDTANAYAGSITGKLTTDFYIDRKERIYYDALQDYSDGFKNNQCTATWTSYKTNSSKKCNWGDRRIPDSKALDIGAAEFSVADPFVKNGWQSYTDAYRNNRKEARKEEDRDWWK